MCMGRRVHTRTHSGMHAQTLTQSHWDPSYFLRLVGMQSETGRFLELKQGAEPRLPSTLSDFPDFSGTLCVVLSPRDCEHTSPSQKQAIPKSLKQGPKREGRGHPDLSACGVPFFLEHLARTSPTLSSLPWLSQVDFVSSSSVFP